MSVVTAEVKVSKEAYELGLALAKLVLEGKKLLKDGAQGSDLPQLLAVLMSKEVAEGIAGLELVPAEMKEDKMAFISAFVVAGTKLAEGM